MHYHTKCGVANGVILQEVESEGGCDVPRTYQMEFSTRVGPMS